MVWLQAIATDPITKAMTPKARIDLTYDWADNPVGLSTVLGQKSRNSSRFIHFILNSFSVLSYQLGGDEPQSEVNQTRHNHSIV
jgi:hypothetical protein